MDNKGKGIVCLIASAFGFALMAACVRLCDDFGGSVSCFQKSLFRNIVAFGLALAVYLRGYGLRRPPGAVPVRAWPLLLLRSALGTLGIFANFYALGHIPIAEGQTLNKTAPFFTVLFASLFLKERAGWRSLAPLLLAFAGVVLITKPGFAGEAALPLAMGLLGGMAAGAAYAALRALGRMATGLPSAFVILFFSAFSCLASVPFLLHQPDPMTGAQIAILFGAGAGAALGQFGITLAYRYAAPKDIAVFDYASVLFAAAFGHALFGQAPDSASVAGFALILLAAFQMRRGQTRRQ